MKRKKKRPLPGCLERAPDLEALAGRIGGMTADGMFEGIALPFPALNRLKRERGMAGPGRGPWGEAPAGQAGQGPPRQARGGWRGRRDPRRGRGPLRGPRAPEGRGMPQGGGPGGMQGGGRQGHVPPLPWPEGAPHGPDAGEV
jgi:hypothetical protein